MNIITRYCDTCKRTTKHLHSGELFACRSLQHPTPLELWLKCSGGGPWMRVGHALNFTEADAVVESLDNRYIAWEEEGYPSLHSDDPLNGYEGCDIEARGLNGRVWMLDGDQGWLLVGNV